MDGKLPANLGRMRVRQTGSWPNEDADNVIVRGALLPMTHRLTWILSGRTAIQVDRAWQAAAAAVARMRVVLAVSGMAALASTAVEGQRVVRVAGPPICTSCSIQLKAVVRLRVPQGAPGFIFPTEILRNHGGGYYVLDPRNPNPISVFDSVGVASWVIGRAQATIGRSFVRTMALTRFDSLHVLSQGDVVFDRFGKRVRAQGVPDDATIYQAMEVSDGRLLIQANIGTPELFGYPFHLLSAGGIRERSFGAANNARVGGNPYAMRQTIGLATTAGAFWASPLNEYRLGLWSADGRLLKSIERDAPWFKPWTSWDSRIDVAPPAPRLLSIWQDAAGLVWTLTSVASKTWKAIPGRSANREAPVPTVGEFARADETMLEVIDPERGVLLASQRVPQALLMFVGKALVAGVSADASAHVSVGIWHLEFISPKRK